jgi:hypothetical protein
MTSSLAGGLGFSSLDPICHACFECSILSLDARNDSYWLGTERLGELVIPLDTSPRATLAKKSQNEAETGSGRCGLWVSRPVAKNFHR